MYVADRATSDLIIVELCKCLKQDIEDLRGRDVLITPLPGGSSILTGFHFALNGSPCRGHAILQVENPVRVIVYTRDGRPRVQNARPGSSLRLIRILYNYVHATGLMKQSGSVLFDTQRVELSLPKDIRPEWLERREMSKHLSL